MILVDKYSMYDKKLVSNLDFINELRCRKFYKKISESTKNDINKLKDLTEAKMVDKII